MAGRKKNPHELIFRIDAFTPDTLPLDKLAQYLAELSSLYGDTKGIHLRSIGKGSAKVKTTVDQAATDPLRNRLEAIRRHEATSDAMAAYGRVDALLQRDNAVGYVSLGGKKILEFSGRKNALPTTIGPIVQSDTIDGELIRVGGKDDTVPVHLLEGDGLIRHCTANRTIAKQLAPHLYSQVRLSGTASWYRQNSGEWILGHFRVDSFTPLKEVSISEAVGKLQDQDGQWDHEVLSNISDLRGSDD